ncbi:hypothetical protein A3D76_00840 [Candidatus Roizmanbacteria bacterium RIFCSPHIGHO2_02_FULL_37_9b]|nr:MAG: hypothetical protein A3D76_00840 [Candidatus Roizmanbacteria bacterium RIFCSPHIGHO2_02_FULL_37_9b]
MIGGEENATGNTPNIEYSATGAGRYHFDISNLNLAAKKGALAIPLQLRKIPIDRITAQTKIDGSVVIGESKQLEELMLKAKELKDLLLDVQLKSLMDLTKSTIKYFGKAIKEELKESNTDEFNWLDQNVTSKSHYKATLAEAIKHGYGICGHFTALYSLLAQEAGLQVVINHADGDKTPVNIVRSDNSQSLFKEVPVGEKVGAHMFLEVLKDNQAIPIDPTTNLNGTNKEQSKMFQEAQYYDVLLAFGLHEINVEPPNTLFINLSAYIPAGNLTHQGRLDIQNHKEADFSGNLNFDMNMSQYRKSYNGGLEIIV